MVNQHHIFYYHHAVDVGQVAYAEGDTDIYWSSVWIMEEDVRTVPEWISRIQEQLSVSYAGLGMKYASDYKPNIYLDILNYTRVDKELRVVIFVESDSTNDACTFFGYCRTCTGGYSLVVFSQKRFSK